MLKLEQVQVNFADYKALVNCDLELKRGEFVSLLGPNGAGKSTALKVLSGDIKPTHGLATIDGQDIYQQDPIVLAKARAVMTQSYELMFDFQAQEVVEMAGHVYAEQYSRQQLKAFAQKAMMMTQVDDLKDHNFNSLSGGQKQRVQLARVINQILPALEAKQDKLPFLLIDEPTSSLDLYHQYEVMKFAKGLAQQGVGVLSVVHDLALAASFSDRLYLLNKGEIVSTGNSHDVLNEPQVQQTYGIKAHLSHQDNYYPSLSIIKAS